MEKKVEEGQSDTSTERKPWVTPEISFIRAGDAENSNKVTFDGVAGQS